MEVKHNPVIGFSIVDKDRRIIGPPGTKIDPIFYTAEHALAAAERYGRSQDVLETVAEHLEGIFNVVIWDEGDMMLDGRSAKRFIKACRRRGLKPDKKAAKAINSFEISNKYSARSLLGNIDLNRSILLSEML
jgi:hypothetical protein